MSSRASPDKNLKLRNHSFIFNLNNFYFQWCLDRTQAKHLQWGCDYADFTLTSTTQSLEPSPTEFSLNWPVRSVVFIIIRKTNPVTYKLNLSIQVSFSAEPGGTKGAILSLSLLTRSQGLMAHLIYLSISFTITWIRSRSAPRRGSIRSQERIDLLSILSLWLVYTGHMTNGSRSPLGSRSGADREQIPSLFRASDWHRQITWLKDLLLICSWERIPSILSPWLAQTDQMGIRSREQTGPLPKINKFLTFDSISTSDDESDVLKIWQICSANSSRESVHSVSFFIRIYVTVE